MEIQEIQEYGIWSDADDAFLKRYANHEPRCVANGNILSLLRHRRGHITLFIGSIAKRQ